MVPQASGGLESELDEEIDLTAAGDTVGKCRVDEREREGTGMVGVVDITAATLWPMLLLLLGLGGVGVLNVVGTADTTATTLVCPVTI